MNNFYKNPNLATARNEANEGALHLLCFNQNCLLSEWKKFSYDPKINSHAINRSINQSIMQSVSQSFIPSINLSAS
jgi:hypothetical protein